LLQLYSTKEDRGLENVLADDLGGGDAKEVAPLARHRTAHDDAVLLDAHDLELADGGGLVTFKDEASWV